MECPGVTRSVDGGKPGSLWPGVTSSDQVRTCDQATWDVKLWPSVTRWGYVTRLHGMPRCDQKWPVVTICDHLWPGVSSCDQLWPGKKTWDHVTWDVQVRPAVTRCDQLWPAMTWSQSHYRHLITMEGAKPFHNGTYFHVGEKVSVWVYARNFVTSLQVYSCNTNHAQICESP